MNDGQIDPDVLKEAQTQQCIFCQIISGQVASKKVYEDDRCIAILDINPANPGHVLLLPKKHHSILPLVPADETAHLFNVARRISTAQIAVLNADGTNLFVANGTVAGQRAPHVMIHIIPRKEKDGITVFSLPKNELSDEDSEKLKEVVKAKVEELLAMTGE
jgi:histidine triad (HIT) family protein